MRSWRWKISVVVPHLQFIWFDLQVVVFVHDGGAEWHVGEKLEMEDFSSSSSLAISGNTILVGLPYACEDQGKVLVYNNNGGTWKN